MTLPFVSVVVLNYNGLRFLDGCLGSLSGLDYPRDRHEVVLVDNVSRDGSVEIAEKLYPWIRVVRNGRNLGFAGGNNVAMRSASADYVVLLNNDTSVAPDWLSRLVAAAEADPIIGACTSKLLFTHDRARVTISSGTFRPAEFGSTDQRELGIRLLDAEVLQDGDSQKAEALEGFYGEEASPDGSFRWTGASATLGLRLRGDGGEARLRIELAGPRSDGRATSVTVGWGDMILASLEVGAEPVAAEIAIPAAVVRSATPVIQNAGTLVLSDGSGRDRGAVVHGTEVFQEDDEGQYDRPEEVFAGCGAALLLKRAMLDDVGVFDEDFFMYYEDMDLSWRMRRRGWTVRYVPDAVVRHLHCGSSVEWSPLFYFHVERNRLLTLAKNAPAGLAVAEHVRYFGSVALNLARFARALVLRTPDLAALTSRVSVQMRVAGSLARLLPSTVAKRRALARSEAVPASRLAEWMVEG